MNQEIIKELEKEQLKSEVPQFHVGDKESSGIGVEKTWPLHSPNVEGVTVVREGKVRRKKLFYLRQLSGKKARVKAKNNR